MSEWESLSAIYILPRIRKEFREQRVQETNNSLNKRDSDLNRDFSV